jgi:hypothetical protein
VWGVVDTGNFSLVSFDVSALGLRACTVSCGCERRLCDVCDGVVCVVCVPVACVCDRPTATPTSQSKCTSVRRLRRRSSTAR